MTIKGRGNKGSGGSPLSLVKIEKIGASLHVEKEEPVERERSCKYRKGIRKSQVLEEVERMGCRARNKDEEVVFLRGRNVGGSNRVLIKVFKEECKRNCVAILNHKAGQCYGYTWIWL